MYRFFTIITSTLSCCYPVDLIKICCHFPLLKTGDVHYAELTLQMPKEETKSLLNHTKKPPPPPAYSYFDDPTIYAQIDHCNFSKSSTANLLGSSGQSLNNGSLKTVVSGVGGSLMMTEQNSQFNQLISPLTHTPSSTLSNQTMLISGNSIGSSGCISNSGTLSHASSATPTATFTSISAGTTSQYPSSNYQTLPLPTANKQFLRDVVTVKTPLSFSEQESCV